MRYLILSLALVSSAIAADPTLVSLLSSSGIPREKVTFAIFRERLLDTSTRLAFMADPNSEDFFALWNAIKTCKFIGNSTENIKEPWIMFTVHGAVHSKMPPFEEIFVTPDGYAYFLGDSNTSPRLYQKFSAPELETFCRSFMDKHGKDPLKQE